MSTFGVIYLVEKSDTSKRTKPLVLLMEQNVDRSFRLQFRREILLFLLPVRNVQMLLDSLVRILYLILKKLARQFLLLLQKLGMFLELMWQQLIKFLQVTVM